MATTKAQALAGVTAQDMADMETLRVRVENAIRHYDGGTVTVTPHGSRKVRDRVAEEYRAAGWTVEFGDDQRDGAWMVLK